MVSLSRTRSANFRYCSLKMSSSDLTLVWVGTSQPDSSFDYSSLTSSGNQEYIASLHILLALCFMKLPREAGPDEIEKGFRRDLGEDEEELGGQVWEHVAWYVMGCL
jgi:hypothetical protein